MNCVFQSFCHFVGATSGSTDLYRLLTRFWAELLPADEPAPTDLDQLKRSMVAVINKASASLAQNGKQRLVILVDALNQMDDDGKETSELDTLHILQNDALNDTITFFNEKKQ